MALNTTLESLNFNTFIVNDSLNNNSQGLHVKFFHENVSVLDTEYISSCDVNGNFKDFKENSFSFLDLHLRSINKTLNILQNFINHQALNSALLVFQKRGLMMKISVKIHFFNQKTAVCYMKTENIAETGKLLFLCMNLFAAQNETILA